MPEYGFRALLCAYTELDPRNMVTPESMMLVPPVLTSRILIYIRAREMGEKFTVAYRCMFCHIVIDFAESQFRPF